MKRKLMFAAFSALSLLCTACTATGEPVNTTADTVNELNSSTLLKFPKLNASKESPDGYEDFVTKVNAFSTKLSESVLKNYDNSSNENISISPLSAYMCLAMSAECADGNTREEITEALGITYNDIAKYTNPLFNKLLLKENKATVSLTNSIWIDSLIDYKEAGITSLANNYSCYPYLTQFKTNNDQANADITEFINYYTNGLINKNFNLSKDTLFTIMNTLYMKARWTEELEKSTSKYPFTNFDGSISQKERIYCDYEQGSAYKGDNYSAFYATTDSNYKIKFILPDENVDVNDVFTADVLSEVNSIKSYNFKDSDIYNYSTRCVFSSFEASIDADLTESLKALGVNELFNSNCNFSNLTDDNVYCNKINHVTKLNVDEKGIEGAAVTLEQLYLAAYDENVKLDFVVDRSFAYIITTSTDIPLFTGIIYKI